MNTEELKNLFSRIKSDKKLMLVLIIGFTGILLIMLSGTDKESKELSSNDEEHIIISEKDLAYDVERFVSNIKGAGKAKALLTFEAYEETVYALNNDEKGSTDGSYDKNNEYVIIDSGSSETGLKLKLLSPKVRGVAIICEGGDNPIVKEQIITVLSALFDISSNKISVATMAD